MLKEVTTITISQNSTGRSKVLTFDFCNHWEFSNNWEDLSAQGKVILPKNCYVVDETNNRFSLYGKNKFVQDIFKRGDKIKIESYYIYWDDNLNQYATEVNTIVQGFITKIKAQMPIVLEFEDNMFKLKQIPMKNQSFKPNTPIETILKDALQGYPYTVNDISETKVKITNALLTAENETVAQFLAKLKKDMFFFPYFRGNELRIGSLVYVEADAKTKTFEFQNNIISSNLEYNRKDDIVLSAVASNHVQEIVGQTKDGTPKTKNKRLEVLVTFRNGKDIPYTKIIKEHDKPDPNIDGERRTFTFLEATTTDQLIKLATIQLKKYYYTGFKGKFTTFGTPFVQFGDNCQIINPLLPEQNGTYKIKGVEYSGGVEGYRQTIQLDYRINI